MNEILSTKEIELPSFIKKQHELSPLLKKLIKESEAALAILVAGIKQEEDKKLSFDCAVKLIEFQLKTAKQVNDDTVQRLIAEIRLKPNRAKNLEVDDDSSSYPVVDFTTVREV